MAGDDCLDNDVFDLVHELGSVAALLLQDLEHRPETPLVAFIASIVFAVLVVVRKLVDRVVGQMHKIVSQITVGRLFVSFRAEPCECHLMQVNPEWVHAVDHHVEP